MTFSPSSLLLFYPKYETFLPAFVQIPQNNWLSFEYFYIFLGKQRTLLKFTFIHFVPRKAGKPIRLFSLIENIACRPVIGQTITSHFEQSEFMLFIICAVYQHVHNNQIHIRHYSYCSCNLVSTTREGTK